MSEEYSVNKHESLPPGAYYGFLQGLIDEPAEDPAMVKSKIFVPENGHNSLTTRGGTLYDATESDIKFGITPEALGLEGILPKDHKFLFLAKRPVITQGDIAIPAEQSTTGLLDRIRSVSSANTQTFEPLFVLQGMVEDVEKKPIIKQGEPHVVHRVFRQITMDKDGMVAASDQWGESSDTAMPVSVAEAIDMEFPQDIYERVHKAILAEIQKQKAPEQPPRVVPHPKWKDRA